MHLIWSGIFVSHSWPIQSGTHKLYITMHDNTFIHTHIYTPYISSSFEFIAIESIELVDSCWFALLLNAPNTSKYVDHNKLHAFISLPFFLRITINISAHNHAFIHAHAQYTATATLNNFHKRTPAIPLTFALSIA